MASIYQSFSIHNVSTKGPLTLKTEKRLECVDSLIPIPSAPPQAFRLKNPHSLTVNQYHNHALNRVWFEIKYTSMSLAGVPRMSGRNQ